MWTYIYGMLLIWNLYTTGEREGESCKTIPEGAVKSIFYDKILLLIYVKVYLCVNPHIYIYSAALILFVIFLLLFILYFV
jgi:hypothetical protein